MLCKRVAIIKEGKIIKVEDIETLRKKQLKKVQIEFVDQMIAEKFMLAGIEKVIMRAGNQLSFLYSGEINELIALLSGNKMINLTIEEPSLEEIFMHYYK